MTKFALTRSGILMEVPFLRRFHRNSTMELVGRVAGDETVVEIAS